MLEASCGLEVSGTVLIKQGIQEETEEVMTLDSSKNVSNSGVLM